MDSPILIGLSGLRGVGKDTTLHFIREWAETFDPAPSVVRRGFADKMKWAYMRMWVPGCTMEWAINFIDQYKNDPNAMCAGILLARDGITLNPPDEFIPSVNFRDHMDQFATESAREVYGEDHWVDMLLPKPEVMDSIWKAMPSWQTNFLVKQDENVMVPADICGVCDLRAENEMRRFDEIPNSLKVKIRRRDREQEVYQHYIDQGREPHLFAQELPDDKFDVVLVNDDNDMSNSRIRTYRMMDEVDKIGVDRIKYHNSRSGGPWVIK
jgi:hypothetical protein